MSLVFEQNAESCCVTFVFQVYQVECAHIEQNAESCLTMNVTFVFLVYQVECVHIYMK